MGAEPACLRVDGSRWIVTWSNRWKRWAVEIFKRRYVSVLVSWTVNKLATALDESRDNKGLWFGGPYVSGYRLVEPGFSQHPQWV